MISKVNSDPQTRFGEDTLMPYANPDVRKKYHKEYSRQWLQRQPEDYRKSRTPAQKEAQRRWLEKNPLYNAQYYAAKKSEFRNRALRRLYGISLSGYQSILQKQGGLCAICGTDKPSPHGKKQFSVDHCHVSGRVRGLLCGKCNVCIGWKERFDQRANEYLTNG